MDMEYKIETDDGKGLFEDFNPLTAAHHWAMAKKKGLKVVIRCKSDYLAWQLRSIIEHNPAHLSAMLRIPPAEAAEEATKAIRSSDDAP